MIRLVIRLGPLLAATSVIVAAPTDSAHVRDMLLTKIPASLYETWSSMRNSAAHGADSVGDIEKRWLDLNRVLFLFHSLVLAFIRYSGLRADYCEPGVPTVAWPLK